MESKTDSWHEPLLTFVYHWSTKTDTEIRHLLPKLILLSIYCCHNNSVGWAMSYLAYTIKSASSSSAVRLNYKLDRDNLDGQSCVTLITSSRHSGDAIFLNPTSGV